MYKFEVAEYVLPKFDVSIETSKHHYYKDGKLRATIRSKYTYGRALKGEATVSVYPKTYGSFQPLISNLITRKVMKIDGKAFFEFDIKDELKFNEDYEQAIAIEAVVEEELTGRKQNTTMEIALHKSKYKIDFVKSSSSYKPGLPFTVTVSWPFSFAEHTATATATHWIIFHEFPDLCFAIRWYARVGHIESSNCAKIKCL